MNYESFAGVTALDGSEFRLYTDPDRLERHMKGLSPADAVPAGKSCGFIRKLSEFTIPVGRPAELTGFLDGMKTMIGILPFMKLFGELFSLTLNDFAARFRDPLIGEGIRNANYGVPGSLFSIVMPLAAMSRKTGGYPLGGSLEFARAIETRFSGLGGTVGYGERVTRVLEQRGRATGVRLENGTVMEADYIVSSCDLRSTLFNLLDGSRIDPVHRELLDTDTLIGPVTQVAFGANLDLSDSPAAQFEVFQLPKPLSSADGDSSGSTSRTMLSSHRGASWQIAAPQHVPLRVVTLGEARWRPGIQGREGKDRRGLLDALETRYPGIRDKVEMVDVATPLTYERYTGNWKGTHMTWEPTLEFQKRYRIIPENGSRAR